MYQHITVLLMYVLLHVPHLFPPPYFTFVTVASAQSEKKSTDKQVIGDVLIPPHKHHYHHGEDISSVDSWSNWEEWLPAWAAEQ